MSKYDTGLGQSVSNLLLSNPDIARRARTEKGGTEKVREFGRLITMQNARMDSVYAPDAKDSDIIKACNEIKVINKHRIAQTRALNTFSIDKQARVDSLSRLDSASVFRQPDLTAFDPIRYQVLYQDQSRWREFFPMVDENWTGAKQYSYKMFDITGKAKYGAAAATNIPRVGRNRKDYFKDIHPIFLGYDFTVEEAEAHMFAGESLESDSIRAVFRGYDSTYYDLLFEGDSELNIDPIINHPDVTEDVAATVATFTTWLEKADGGRPDLILQDISTMIGNVNTASLDLFANEREGMTIAVPLEQYQLINSTYLNTANASNISVYAAALATIRGLANIVPIIELDGAGAGSTDLMLGWINNPEYVHFRITQGMTWYPMHQPNSQTFNFDSKQKFVGVVLRHPVSMRQMRGI